jgi:hypothetical protein
MEKKRRRKGEENERVRGGTRKEMQVGEARYYRTESVIHRSNLELKYACKM